MCGFSLISEGCNLGEGGTVCLFPHCQLLRAQWLQSAAVGQRSPVHRWLVSLCVWVHRVAWAVRTRHCCWPCCNQRHPLHSACRLRGRVMPMDGGGSNTSRCLFPPAVQHAAGESVVKAAEIAD